MAIKRLSSSLPPPATLVVEALLHILVNIFNLVCYFIHLKACFELEENHSNFSSTFVSLMFVSSSWKLTWQIRYMRMDAGYHHHSTHAMDFSRMINTLGSLTLANDILHQFSISSAFPDINIPLRCPASMTSENSRAAWPVTDLL